jgi:hypothetical protein
MTTLEYLKTEGIYYYLSWPGIWIILIPAALVAGFFNYVSSSGSCPVDTVSSFFMILPTVTGISLAIGVTAITFQLGTFNVDELRNFVLDDNSMKQFDIMRAAAHWTVSVLIICFLAGIVLLVLSKLNWINTSYAVQSLFLFIALAVVGLAISHARFAARAAFDFASFKVALAQAIEQAEIDEQERKKAAGPPAQSTPPQQNDNPK